MGDRASALDGPCLNPGSVPRSSRHCGDLETTSKRAQIELPSPKHEGDANCLSGRDEDEERPQHLARGVNSGHTEMPGLPKAG